MKKIISFILATVMFISLVPFEVLPKLPEAKAATSGYYTYSVSDGKATITDVDTSISGNKTIPSTLGGYPVTSIGSDAFYDCRSLTSVTIPDSVTSIGYDAFDGCSSLTSVIVDKNNQNFSSLDDVLFNKNKTELICYPTGKSGSYTIPDSVTSIGSGAFYDCEGLTSVTIPDSVTSIGSYAFWGCRSLTSITIPDGVTSIGNNAFYYCFSLTSVIIPDSVTSIGSNAFGNTGYHNNSSNWENGVLYIGKYLIDAKDISGAYSIKEGTLLIGGSAFYYCFSLTSVIIPDSVTSIGSDAFYYCTGLTSVTIGNSVTSIGDYAFYDCISLKNIYYLGTEKEWKNLNADVPSGTTVYYDCVNKIEVTTFPNKLIYTKDYDELDLAGGKLTIYYGSNLSIAVDLSKATVTGFDNTKAGVQTLTVTYYGKTTTFEVEIVNAKKLEVLELPSKLIYAKDYDELDLTGGKLTIYFYDDSTKVVDLSNATVTGFDNTAVGTQTLTVYYGGKTTTFEIEVSKVEEIEVTTLPSKLSYLEGKDTLNLTGGVLTIYYSNGKFETVALSKAIVSGFDNSVVGKQTLTISYGGKTTTFEVEIIAKLLTSIEVTTLPSKTNYLEGKDNLNFSDGVLTLHYDNGTSKVIALSEAAVTGFDNTIVGTQTLTVSYGGKTTTFTVEVIAKSLTSIEITILPTKTKYLEGKDNLDLSDGVLTLHYDNGTSKVIALSEAAVTGFDNTAVGTQTLTVSYGDKTTTFEVEVIAKSPSSLEFVSLPTKLSYLEAKDSLDLSGGVLTLHYDNGTSETVALSEASVTGFDNTIPGVQVLTVSYSGEITTFEVEVIAKTATSLSITTLPDKLQYSECLEELDLTGGKIRVIYDNGTYERLDLNLATVTGFDNAISGTQILTVSYRGANATFEIEVIARTLSSVSVTTLPSKTEYVEGKEFDKSGMVVTAYYNNGTSEEITDYQLSGYDSTIGTKVVTVTYKGFSDSFEVEVIAKSLTSIEVTTLPSKTEYMEFKDDLDLSAGVLTLHYDNGTSKVIALSEAAVTGFDNTIVGTQTLTVSYGGFNTTFEVIIYECPHEVQEWKTILEPTCLEEGIMVKECSNCLSIIERKTIEALGHSYSNVCDSECNDCEFVRVPPHDWETELTYDTNNHWIECSECGEKKDETAHVYDDVCDATCDCGNSRVAPHDWNTEKTYDAENHWIECSECGEKKDETAHVYDDVCDATCDCGNTRVAPHDWKTELTYDTNNHWIECSECGEKKDIAAHEYDDCCDATCDCGYVRVVPHDWVDGYCDNCGKEKPFCGDADDDGEISTGDAIVILQYIAGYDVPLTLSGADINNDAKVDVGDAVLLLQHIAGYNVKEFN